MDGMATSSTYSQPTSEPEPTTEPKPAPAEQKPEDESTTPAPGEGWPDGTYPETGIFGYIVEEAQEV